MSTVNDGGPAFPVEYDHQVFAPKTVDYARRLLSGMSLRDYFAAKALPAVYADYCAGAHQTGFDPGWMDGVAIDAYAMADSMLKARTS